MLKFKYKKANGDISERFGLIVKAKQDHALMMDLTEVTPDLRYKLERDWEEYKLLHDALWDQYEFSKYLKTFKEEGIFDRRIV